MLNTPTRRSLLLATVALAGVSLFGTVNIPGSAYASGNTSPNHVMSFAGPNLIQIIVYDTKILDPKRRDITDSDKFVWQPNFKSRKGSLAVLNGVSGAATGNSNPNIPQSFFNWAQVVKGSELKGLNGPNASIDRTDLWDVMIDGKPSKVLQVYRKTVPIKARRSGPSQYIHEKRHLITLQLSSDIAQGAAVILKHSSIGIIKALRDNSVVSESVHVCHEGYPVSGPKKGYVGLWLGQNAEGKAGSTDAAISESTGWQLINTVTGEAVLSGVLELAKAADDTHDNKVNYNGCDIYLADFTSVKSKGTYRLEIDDVGASVEFSIDVNPYEPILRLAARWYYHQRSGIAIESPFGEGRIRPRNGHPDDMLIAWQTDIKLGTTSEGNGGPYPMPLLNKLIIDTTAVSSGNSVPVGAPNLNAWGGWHDAGDWDRRIQHMDAVYNMANMIELFSSVRDLNMNIPESGRTFKDAKVLSKKDAGDTGDGETVLPDLIHEALWGISLWRRTQTDEGAVIGGVEYSSDSIIGSVSWNPVQRTYAYKVEPWAAYRFAAAAAKLGHVIKTVCGDKVLGQALIDEADLAWSWAEKQWPDLVAKAVAADENPIEEVPESSVVPNIFRARIAASAALYRANRNHAARAVFEDFNPFAPVSDKNKVSARSGVFLYESIEYLKAAREGADYKGDIVVNMRKWIVHRLTKVKRIGIDYGLHSAPEYSWGIGWTRFGPGSNYRAKEVGLQYIVGYQKPEFIRDIVIEGMWFGLGCNPSNISFVQGLGKRQFGDPTGADFEGYSKIPGQISFGVAAGSLHKWELRRTKGQIYPPNQEAWPHYAKIFESNTVAICAEHGMKSNAMEWLFACAHVNQIIKDTRM